MYIVTDVRGGTVSIWEGEDRKDYFPRVQSGYCVHGAGLRNVIGEYFNRIAGPCLED